jgi:hypothetical protein
MRVGSGTRTNPGPNESETTLHRPLIPDDRYLSWQYSPHNRPDWGELFFSVGNTWAKATVALQSFNFTEATWGQTETQLGISQGFVTVFSDLGYENVRLRWRVGAFTDKYGMAGQYDAGEYETYLFGRTHQMGESLHVEFDLDPSWTLWGDHGIGTKRPDPDPNNNARFTMLHHVHAGINQGKNMQFSAHYLHSWAQEETREYNPADGGSLRTVGDGKLWVAGADARFDFGKFGYLYAGYSHLGATRAATVSGAIEVLHSSGGGESGAGITENYFGPSLYTRPTLPNAMNPDAQPACTEDVIGNTAFCSMGTGSIDSVLGQYEISFAELLAPDAEAFSGEGQDVKLVLYGMFNKVASDYAPVGPAAATEPSDGITKLKFGADAQWHALSWLTGAVRFDRLQPNSEIPEQSFSILSPRLVFSSDWLTHEQVTIQYSRYMYADRICSAGATAACVQPPASPNRTEGFGSFAADPANGGDRAAPQRAPMTPANPDLNVFKIEATFWW